MSLEFIFRIIGMVVFGLLGGYLGVDISNVLTNITTEEGAVILGLVGALFGLVLTPFFTTRPLRSLRALLARLDTKTLTSGLVGLTVGLVIAALLAFPLSLLPSPLGEMFPFIGVLLFGYIGVAVFIMRRNDFFSFFGGRMFSISEKSISEDESNRTVLVDTSVIIDGRIADIAKTGFLVGELLIPRFVLDELQYIADSADGLRRQRGRRGMEILAELQETQTIPVRISDIDVEGTREVDSKLVILARQLSCPILTNDYNLNRVAEIQGVPVLNINELANSVKAVLLPGESVKVKIIQEGKEHGQGVGYLSDGTMVVVEDGKNYLNKDLDTVVTKVLQTAAGRMIFAKPD